MQSNKLLDYLARLNNDEMKRFTSFMQSPYHTTNKPACALVQTLNKHHPTFDNPRLKKRMLFKKIYGADRPFHEGRLDQVMTQTVRLFEQFLAIDKMLHSPLEISKNCMAAMQDKKMDNAYFREGKKRKKLIKELPEGPKKYLEGSLFYKDLFYHPATDRQRPEMTAIEKYVENLDSFILWEKQLSTNFILNRQIVFSKNFNNRLYEEVTKSLSEKINKNYTLQVLHSLAKQQKEINEKEVLALSKEYLNNTEKIEKKYETLIYSLLKNIMAKAMRYSPNVFSRPIFNLLKTGRKNNWDLIDGKIKTNNMTGLLSMASKLGEFSYAEKLIKDCLHLIEIKDQKDVFNIGKGYIHFWKGDHNHSMDDFKLAIDYLLKINQNKIFFSYQVKSLLLRCYYEMDKTGTGHQFFVIDFSLAFERHLVRDQTLSEVKAKAYKNFCKYSRKLVKLRFEKNDIIKKRELLKTQIKKEKILFAKEWLLSKT